ncbi:sacsin isoform X2 [Senna tora]|uniref:Sacsin isoform X2 n=1 Tax=Senna tora TaxID=362788 RepID=A0A834SRJ3_9FABA|nr:sacsin isoform X2 [Senna tora]
MYDGVTTCVRTQGSVTKDFPITIGLHQGSALSPYLFNLVLDVLTEHIQEAVPRCMLFADDIVLVGDSTEQVNEKLEKWRQALETYGFRISRSKTEYMKCKFSGRDVDSRSEVKLGDHPMREVTSFKYLGTIIQNNGEIEEDVNHRIQAGWMKWRKASDVICDKKVPLKLKGKFYRTAIRPALLYGTECWAIKSQHEHKFNVAEMRMLRWMSGHTRMDRIRNDYIREKVGVAPIVEKLVETRLRWFGHVQRRPEEAPTDVPRNGRAFCFLPLPVRTGLSVQVNGFFEVSSNRRGIWYGADMDRSGKVRSIWNRLLLEDVVAPSFMHLLLDVKELLGPTDSYYSLWPIGSFEEPWSLLVQKIYRSVCDAPVLYSDLEGGKWVSPGEAFLHDQEFIKSEDLGLALIQLGMPVVNLPNPLLDMLLKYDSSKVVTPGTVRQFLRERKACVNLSKPYKLVLLEYCLDDLVDDDVGIEAYNLPLLPLANGEFGFFLEDPKEISYFICDELEYTLLQPVSNQVIDRNIPPNILSRLFAIAKSSKTNLKVFSIHHFVQLFHAFMPNDWKYKSKVHWDAESCQKPTSAWFMLFWQYLGNKSEILSLFSDWPILPSTSGNLLRPSGQLKLINGNNLSNTLQDILIKIGCHILNPSYVVEHPDLSNYLYDGNATGVLESIFHAFSSAGIMQPSLDNLIAEERNVLREFLLDPKWYVGRSMNEFTLSYCRRLPIYQVYGGECAQVSQFSDLENPPKYLPPLDVPEFVFGVEFIRSSSIEEDILSRYHGVDRMRKAQFYKRYIFNRVGELQSEVRDSIMLSVLQNLPLLSLEDITIRDLLRNLEFIPTVTGALKCPSVLYDPSNEELYALLENSDCFPSGPFQEYEILDILRGLGLRTSVSIDTVIESARRIEHLMHEDQQRAHSRGKVLLSYLEINAMKWLSDQVIDNKGTVNRMLSRAASAFRSRNTKSDLEKFWNDLRLISWCPVLVSAPFQLLPWPAVSSMVAPPKLVRPQTDLWLVSASMRILDGECSSTALLYSLGWMSPPGGSVIAAQLLELGKNNEIVTDQVLRQELALAMPRIYSILSGLIGSDEIDIVKAVLEGCRWIWVGDGFATSDEVVLDGPLHLAPYIRVIPVDLAVFKDLFMELGIREYLQPADYANILCRMAARKGSSPLDAQEIRAVTLIVHHLAEVHLYDQKVQIYLPDVSGRLFLAGDLVYNDAPWLLGPEDPDGSFGNASTASWNAKRSVQKFVHGNISNDVAERLGVCSLRRTLLAESADSMNLGLSGAAEAFGQHEALTTRLKHILEMYADGPGTLFELVQNAEDAGASEVILLLDKSHYGTSSVLSPEMADWQGPALYCFNDSVFSPQDLYAISRIGQESKLEKPLAIGRFGLGFNSVYHFTDVPMFVSGENIVMFDPHASNLPGISPSHPGLRIKFVGRQILEQFPDQFSSLLHFGCDLQHPYPGTLFRFPLRTASVASRSQIKKEVYAPEDVRSLFGAFSDVVSETLLFLRNVKSISIFIKEGTEHEMHLLHRVRRTCIGEPNIGSAASQEIYNFFNENRQVGMNRDQFLKKLSKSIDRDLPYKCQKILVAEQSTSGSNLHCWITTECIGGGNAQKSTSAASNKNSYNSVPWACVAAYLNSLKLDGNLDHTSEMDDDHLVSPDLFQVVSSSINPRDVFEGRAFCFLPLPISTGFPVHVNAYFELSSNRRDIWFGSDMTGGGRKRSDWNIYLLENVIAPAYGRLLEKVALEVGPCDLFFSFWPTTTGLEPWASVVRRLYRFVAEFGLRVLYTEARGGQWISTKHAIFPDFTFHKAAELIKALSGACLPVVTVPQSLVERFMEICPSLHFLSPKFLRTLLIRRKREFKDKDAIILTLEYCLLDLEVSMQYDTFCGLSLLPLADGSFATIDKKGVGERVYVARGDEYGLLKDFVPRQLIDFGIPEEVHKKLCYIAQSDSTNISFLSCQLLEKLLVKLLPVQWQHARQVSWTPNVHGQPSLEWLQLLWNYLKSYCDDLSVFCKWPILPVGNNCLMQLTPDSNVIKNEGWSEKMSSLLLKVGCLFLRRDLQLDHPQLEYFVQSPTARGVLSVFLAIAGEPEKIEGIFTDASDGELHELRSFILQSKWFSEEQMDNTHIEIIKHLPVFESYKSRKLVSLSNPMKWLGPSGVREDLLNDSFIRTESEMERVIMGKFLEIKEPTKVEFYKDHIFNHMSEFILKQEAISAILHDVQNLIQEDVSIKSVLSASSFVLAANGSWQQPSRLYDPRVPEIQKMLRGNAFFPSEKFLDPEILDTLVSLGLRRTLGFTGLLDCARSVSLLHESGDAEALQHGRELLVFVDALSHKLSDKAGNSFGALQSDVSVRNNSIMDDPVAYDGFHETDDNFQTEDNDIDSFVSSLTDDMSEEEFWTEIKVISWCPVISDPPILGLPWLKSNIKVASPKIVRPKSQIWMVSSSMHILDGECRTTYLQTKLGWMDCPKVGVLSKQLFELSKSYRQLKSRSFLESDFDAQLQKEIPYLYSKLQEYINTEDFIELKAGLDGVSWVWIGDDFVSPNALAFDSPVKFTPYLYVVPSELSGYKDLLIKLGVRLSFGIWDYLHVLQRLQNDVQGVPLSIDQLNFVHCVLEAIAECCLEKPLFEPSDSPLLIPDARGVLMPAGDLVYNDAPWLENNSFVGKHFIHPCVSHDLANRLGVQSIRCLSLVNEDMIKDMPCMDYDKVNELLTLYGNEEFLLFDLLELADCCKAKKLHLIVDKREHPRQSLLQHNLAIFFGQFPAKPGFQLLCPRPHAPSRATVSFAGILTRRRVTSSPVPSSDVLQVAVIVWLLSSHFRCVSVCSRHHKWSLRSSSSIFSQCSFWLLFFSLSGCCFPAVSRDSLLLTSSKQTYLSPFIVMASSKSSSQEASSSNANEFSGNAENSVLLLTRHKLTGQNYLHWSRSMIMFITGKGKEDYLTISTKPQPDDPKFKTWNAENQLVMSWLINSMDLEIGQDFMFFASAAEIWKAAKESYSDVENTAELFEIKGALHDLKQGELSVPQYFNTLNRYWLQLDMFECPEWKCSEDAETYKKLVEKERIYKFLLGLNKSLDNIRGRILSVKPLPSLREVLSTVRHEESRRKLMLGSLADSDSVNGSALAVHGASHNPGSGQKKGRPWCDHCHRTGHVKDKCWKLHGKPSDWKSLKDKNIASGLSVSDPKECSSSAVFSKEQMAVLQKLLNQGSSHVVATGGTAEKGNFSTGLHITSNPSRYLIVDSGASDHMTGDSGMFSSWYPYTQNYKVRIADGSLADVTGIGEVSLSDSITLKSVLFVPKLKCNLLSVAKLAHDSNCKAEFTHSSCSFQDVDSGKMIGNARVREDLYRFEMNKEVAPNKQSFAAGKKEDSLKEDRDIMVLHFRLGHPNFVYLSKLYPSLFLKKNPNEFVCHHCILAKHCRSSYPRSSYKPSAPFALIHSDIWGPSKIKNISGARWFITFTDDHTRISWVFLLKEKSAAASTFKNFYSMVKNQFNTPIKIFRTDNGREFFNNTLDSFLLENGIVHQSSCVETPQQNGIAERKNRHLLETARALLFTNNVPHRYWGEAVLSAAYLINRLPSKVLNFSTPYKVFTSYFPQYRALSNLSPKIFGCTAYVHNQSFHMHSKLDPKASKCIFIGYSAHQKGYKCFCPNRNKVFTSMDVTFLEDTPYYDKTDIQGEIEPSISELEYQFCHVEPSPVSPDIPESEKELKVYSRRKKDSQAGGDEEKDQEGVDETRAEIEDPMHCQDTPSDPHSHEKGNTDPNLAISDVCPDEILSPPIAKPKGVRSCTLHPISQFVSYEKLSPKFQAFVSNLDKEVIPTNIHEALQHPRWKEAVNEEIKALQKNETWELTHLPPDKHPVGCKWIFNIKYKADGSIERYKARLVARGYTQTYGLDYQETFAPVAKLNTIRVLFSLAVNLDWNLHQLDIKNAFLNGDLEEEVYMDVPPGLKNENKLVCKLKKSLYGLKQSPRAWFERFTKVIKKQGYSQSQSDHTLFFKRFSGNLITILIVYVDDIIVTENCETKVERLKGILNIEFEVKDLGPLRYFLGMEVARSTLGIYISQRKYILDLLKEIGMLGCKPADTPMDPYNKIGAKKDFDPVDKGRYQRLVGKLIYLSHTRPDISFAVSSVSQYMHNPTEEHQEAVDRILRYLKMTPGKGLLFKRGSSRSVDVFSDADWAGSLTDRRSTSGYCTYVWGNLVTWRSKKQQVVSRSSAEVELRALAHGICEGMWLKKLLEELEYSPSCPIMLRCNNQATISMAKNPIHHDRTKHVEIDRHFIKENIDQHIIEVDYIASGKQIADILTKAIPRSQFESFVSKLGMVDIHSPT